MVLGCVCVDPAINLSVVVIILFGTWRLLRDLIDLSIDAVPQGIDVYHIKSNLSGLKNISDIHDLHIWALSTTETALTVHLVTTCEMIDNCFLEEIQENLHHHFNISHATIQIENETDYYICVLNRDECKC